MRRTATRVCLALVAALWPGLAAPARADPGVTVGFGAISQDQPLGAGRRQPLPAIPVANSGDSEGRYRVTITPIEGQPDLRPDPAWFTIRPQDFPLKPGEGVDLAVVLELPWLLQPGRYFCLIQVGPVSEAQGTGLAIAAAAKLSFTVEHGNVAAALAFGTLEAVQQRAPWSYLILAALGVVIGYPLIQRLLGIRIRIVRGS